MCSDGGTPTKRAPGACIAIPPDTCSTRASAFCDLRWICLRGFPLDRPRTIVDLGCGAGNVTKLLGERWPDARIVGVDSSSDMLGEARSAMRNDRRYAFVAADLEQWRPDAPVDLVYSNAALHWLPHHAALFARVAAMVAQGGMLAVQMPDNFRAPSHTLVADIATSERWRSRLGRIVREAPVAAPADYFAWLAPRDDEEGRHLVHRIPTGPGATKRRSASGRGLDPGHVARPVSRGPRRTGAERNSCAKYTRRLSLAYPALRNGDTLFPFSTPVHRR